MKLTLDLPENTIAISTSYIFEDSKKENMFIGSGIVTESELESGNFKCKGAEENDT